MYRSRTPIAPRFLQGAFDDLRKASWPATLSEALADRHCSPLIECLARDRQRRASKAPPGTPVRRAAPPRRLPPRHRFDIKAAQANDLQPDDEDTQP